ncbi:MAG TPA: glycerol-3-phosphate 1-O-acyltransferase PlsY [Gemmatimonadales bacterium]|nr:glycerol-3-phosphate 1-O-acyltransferase PlsY [Gemmatimonadales bacterium]
MTERLVYLVISYLIGAIPTSYLAGRWFRGIDLRDHGSRNLGATNVYRVLGWRFALPVGLVDVAKGAVPVLVFGPKGEGFPHFATLCGVAAIVGHTLSPLVGFRGGKGVATAAGAFLALAPGAVGLAALVWLLLVRLTGYVSVGSMIGALALPVADFLLYPPRRTLGDLGLDLAVAAFIVWKHRPNIRRLLQGTEHRFGRRGAQAASKP